MKLFLQIIIALVMVFLLSVGCVKRPWKKENYVVKELQGVKVYEVLNSQDKYSNYFIGNVYCDCLFSNKIIEVNYEGGPYRIICNFYGVYGTNQKVSIVDASVTTNLGRNFKINFESDTNGSFRKLSKGGFRKLSKSCLESVFFVI